MMTRSRSCNEFRDWNTRAIVQTIDRHISLLSCSKVVYSEPQRDVSALFLGRTGCWPATAAAAAAAAVLKHLGRVCSVH